ncbi:MAG: histidinol-phosphate transaminase [Candidatus Binatia bacterium]
MFRKTVQAMTGYVPGEQPRDRRTIKLNTNENPYPPSPRVLEALAEALTPSLRLYPAPMADELRDRASRVYLVKPENVLVGNGSDELLSLLMRACIDPGDPVAYPVPTYSLYDTLVELHEAEPIRVPFGPVFELPEALIDANARLLFFANPNSPSGTAVPPSEIARLAEARGDRLVVVDEAYVDFASTNCVDLLKDHPNLLVLRTFSKSFSLAGMRIGLALGHESVIATLAKVKDSYNVNRLSIIAASAALRDLRWMERNVERIRETRATLTADLEAIGFIVLPSEANFVLARMPGRDLGPIQQTLKRRGILVRHFAQSGLEDCLRVTVGADDEVRIFVRTLAGLLKQDSEAALPEKDAPLRR